MYLPDGKSDQLGAFGGMPRMAPRFLSIPHSPESVMASPRLSRFGQSYAAPASFTPSPASITPADVGGPVGGGSFAGPMRRVAHGRAGGGGNALFATSFEGGRPPGANSFNNGASMAAAVEAPPPASPVDLARAHIAASIPSFRGPNPVLSPHEEIQARRSLMNEAEKFITMKATNPNMPVPVDIHGNPIINAADLAAAASNPLVTETIALAQGMRPPPEQEPVFERNVPGALSDYPVRRMAARTLGEFYGDDHLEGFSLGGAFKAVKKAVVDTGHFTGKVVTSKPFQAVELGVLAATGVGVVPAAAIMAATKGGGTLIKPGGNLKSTLTATGQGALEGAAAGAVGQLARSGAVKGAVSKVSGGRLFKSVGTKAAEAAATGGDVRGAALDAALGAAGGLGALAAKGPQVIGSGDDTTPNPDADAGVSGGNVGDAAPGGRIRARARSAPVPRGRRGSSAADERRADEQRQALQDAQDATRAAQQAAADAARAAAAAAAAPPPQQSTRRRVAESTLRAGRGAKKAADEQASKIDALTERLEQLQQLANKAAAAGDVVGAGSFSQAAQGVAQTLQRAEDASSTAAGDLRTAGLAAEGAAVGAVGGAGAGSVADFVSEHKGVLIGAGIAVALLGAGFFMTRNRPAARRAA